MSERSVSFREGPALDKLLEWWRGLKNHPADRAELRRCKATSDVFFAPSFHALRLSVRQVGQVSDERLAVAAGALAHVRSEWPKPFAVQMATAKPGGTAAAVSGLRFRRLIQIGADEPDKLLRAMVRVIHLVGETANVGTLADGIYWWNDRIRRQWATEYYTTARQEL